MVMMMVNPKKLCKKCGIKPAYFSSKYCGSCRYDLLKEKLKKRKTKERETNRKQKARAKKLASPSHLKKECDQLWRTQGKMGAKCEVCVTLPANQRINYTQLHAHHFIGRRNLRLRWNLQNRIWLCPIHHDFGVLSAHNDPEWFREWMLKYRKEDFEYCNLVKNDIQYDIDYQKIIDSLK